MGRSKKHKSHRGAYEAVTGCWRDRGTKIWRIPFLPAGLGSYLTSDKELAFTLEP